MKNRELRTLSYFRRIGYCRFGEIAHAPDFPQVYNARFGTKLPTCTAAPHPLTRLYGLASEQLLSNNRRPLDELNQIVSSIEDHRVSPADPERIIVCDTHLDETLRRGRTPSASEIEAAASLSGDTKRYRRELNLPLMDGAYLRSLRAIHSTLNRTTGRDPTISEFAASIRPTPLSSRDLDSFIEFLGEPFYRSWMNRWEWTLQLVPLIEEKLKSAGYPRRTIDGSVACLSLVTKLGVALDHVDFGISPVPSQCLPVASAHVVRSIDALAQQLDRFPTFCDLFLDFTVEEINRESTALRLNKEEVKVWKALIRASKSTGTSVSELASAMPEISALVSSLEPLWQKRDAIALHDLL